MTTRRELLLGVVGSVAATATMLLGKEEQEANPSSNEAAKEERCTIRFMLTPPDAVKVIGCRVQSDDDYAKAWHDSLALSAKAVGVPHYQAQHVAARFMESVFSCTYLYGSNSVNAMTEL